MVISQIVGINIDQYNDDHEEGRWFYQQEVINQAMPLLANTVNCINRENELYSPWITNTVHDFLNHKLYNRSLNYMMVFTPRVQP